VRISLYDHAGGAPTFLAALRDYMVWAVADVLAYAREGSEVPTGVRMPRWSWDGLVTDGA
jgi:hemoglobin